MPRETMEEVNRTEMEVIEIILATVSKDASSHAKRDNGGGE
jgi:hypothetical protein